MTIPFFIKKVRLDIIFITGGAHGCDRKMAKSIKVPARMREMIAVRVFVE